MGYRRPRPGRPLAVQPVLESWDQAGSPSQTRLSAFLDSIAGWDTDKGPAPLALDLVVALPPGSPLTSGGNDLDNYLLPIVRRFGHQRFVAVFGRKTTGHTSALAIEPAQPFEENDDWSPRLVCRTRSAGQSASWKREIAEACMACAPSQPVDRPIALQVRYRLSGRRNWAQQWKPTIDALGAVLGAPDPSHPFNVNDDRIVDLAFVRTIDETLGWDIEVQIDWAPA